MQYKRDKIYILAQIGNNIVLRQDHILFTFYINIYFKTIYQIIKPYILLDLRNLMTEDVLYFEVIVKYTYKKNKNILKENDHTI